MFWFWDQSNQRWKLSVPLVHDPGCSLNISVYLMFIGPCIIVIVEERKTNLMSLAILFHFLCAQHVSDVNISIIRTLRLRCWITTSVVLFSVCCVLELWCGWFWVVFVLQAEVSNVYWTVHHCNGRRTEDQLDVTCYFISLPMCSTCFGH